MHKGNEWTPTAAWTRARAVRGRIKIQLLIGLLALAAAFWAALPAKAIQASAQNDHTGQWVIDTAGQRPGYVRLSLHDEIARYGTGDTPSYIDASQLRGLTREQMGAGGNQVQFQIVRDAGTLYCQGWFRDGKGSGHFTYSPNPAFVAELKRQGYEKPTENQQFYMAMHDVSLTIVEKLNKLGYARPSLAQLMRMRLRTGLPVQATQASAQSDRTGPWIISTEDRRPGYVHLSLQYQTVRDGVGNQASDIEEGQLRGLTREQMGVGGTQVQFQIIRDAGTLQCEGWFRGGKGSGHYTYSPNPAFVAELKRQGYEEPTEYQQFSMTIQNLSLALVEELNRQGYTRPPIDQLVRMSTHGVRLEYIRELNAQGYEVRSVDTLTRMYDHGVNIQFIRGLEAVGYKNLPIETLVRVKDHGVTPELIKELRELGYNNLDLNEAVRAVDHGVNVRFIKEVEEAGYGRLPLRTLARMKDHGVTAEFIKKMQARGLSNLSVEQLIKLSDAGIDK